MKSRQQLLGILCVLYTMSGSLLAMHKGIIYTFNDKFPTQKAIDSLNVLKNKNKNKFTGTITRLDVKRLPYFLREKNYGSTFEDIGKKIENGENISHEELQKKFGPIFDERIKQYKKEHDIKELPHQTNPELHYPQYYAFNANNINSVVQEYTDKFNERLKIVKKSKLKEEYIKNINLTSLNETDKRNIESFVDWLVEQEKPITAKELGAKQLGLENHNFQGLTSRLNTVLFSNPNITSSAQVLEKGRGKQLSKIIKILTENVKHHEDTHVIQQLERNDLNQSMPKLGDLLWHAFPSYLDGLQQDEHGNIFFIPNQKGFFTKKGELYLEEAEACIDAGKLMENPLSYKYVLLKHLYQAESSSNYPSNETLLDVQKEFNKEFYTENPELYEKHYNEIYKN